MALDSGQDYRTQRMHGTHRGSLYMQRRVVVAVCAYRAGSQRRCWISTTRLQVRMLVTDMDTVSKIMMPCSTSGPIHVETTPRRTKKTRTTDQNTKLPKRVKLMSFDAASSSLSYFQYVAIIIRAREQQNGHKRCGR